MSLLNSFLASAASLALGKDQQEQVSVLTALGQVMNNYPGGASAVLERFKAGGLGDVVASWISQDTKALPVTENQLEQTLGSSFIGDMIAKSGLTQQSILSHLTTLLPIVVNAVFKNGGSASSIDAGALIKTVLASMSK